MCSFWGVFAIACWCGTGAPLVKGRGSPVEFRQRVNCRSIHKVALASIVSQASRGYILDSLNRISFENRISSVISQKAKYALRALVALAKEGDSLMIGEIAARKNIPRKFLEQILLEMKRHGIVHSRRGKLGGYSLLMPPDKITYGQVLAHHRRADRPLAVPEPHRLPALRRLQDRGNLRDSPGFCQGGRVGKRGARPHHHRRFPRFSAPCRRGRGRLDTNWRGSKSAAHLLKLETNSIP